MYRVVLCDFDSAMENSGEDKTNATWYDWCIFRNTDQPYLYRQYTPMERKPWGDSYQYRASSLLIESTVINEKDASNDTINRDPQFHIVKDVLLKDDDLYVLTTNDIHRISLNVNCSSYLSCIDCASDPDCMWEKAGKKCVKYEDSQFKYDLHLQDVLDRGFKCVELLNLFNQTNKESIDMDQILNSVGSLSIHCSNAGFWRGRVQWQINGIDIRNNKASKNYLIVTKEETINISNISCCGISDDRDKLYKGNEYQWITKSNYDRVVLNTLKNTPNICPPVNVKTILLIIILFSNFLELILIVAFWIKWKRQCKKRKNLVELLEKQKREYKEENQGDDQQEPRLRRISKSAVRYDNSGQRSRLIRYKSEYCRGNYQELLRHHSSKTCETEVPCDSPSLINRQNSLESLKKLASK